ncbi:hypothetical protein ES705_20091 [subsurface metagenome]
MALNVKERGEELKPARLFAFKLWKENPLITAAELAQALKEKGFEVAKGTSTTWLTRLRKGSRIRTSEVKPRKQHLGRKPNPARLLAFKLWKQNPEVTGAELDKALREEGFQMHISTFYLWLNSFRKGKDVGTYKEKPVTAVEPSKITLEQIIKTVGSIEALSLLFYQGVMEEMKRSDSAYDVLKQECLKKDELISWLKQELEAVTRERNKIIREFNEKIAAVKVGTLTLDQVEHRLIPKTYPHNEPRRL